MSLKDYLKPHDGEKLKEEDIEALEKQYDFRLPEALRQLYLTQNGGFLQKCGNSKFDLPLREILCIKNRFHEHVSTLDEILAWQKEDGFIPMNFIPFCSDEAGDDYVVRVDEEGYGKIYYIFSEFLDSFLEDTEHYLIADSFEEFCDMVSAL